MAKVYPLPISVRPPMVDSIHLHVVHTNADHASSLLHMGAKKNRGHQPVREKNVFLFLDQAKIHLVFCLVPAVKKNFCLIGSCGS